MEDRNQIWGPYLATKQQERSTAEFYYTVKNNRVSPYLELQADDLYGNRYGKGFSKLDVNPYIRFFSVFDSLLTPDDLGYEEFNQALSDILLHYLADLDLKLGMCKQDFYLGFLVKDIEEGAFGSLGRLSKFTGAEKYEVAKWLLSFYQTGDSAYCLSGAVKKLLPSCEMVIREGEEFVFYMREPRNIHTEERLFFFIKLFLPFSSPYVVHWTETYGVIGYDGTMQLGSFVLA